LVVARSYLAALMPGFRYRQTTALLDVGGYAFRAVGRQPIEIGWRAAFGEEAEEEGRDSGEKDERRMLPPLRHGEMVKLREPQVETNLSMLAHFSPQARYAGQLS
jgi:DNA topoisomerase-3